MVPLLLDRLIGIICLESLVGRGILPRGIPYHLLIMEKFEQLTVRRESNQKYTVYIPGTYPIISDILKTKLAWGKQVFTTEFLVMYQILDSGT